MEARSGGIEAESSAFGRTRLITLDDVVVLEDSSGIAAHMTPFHEHGVSSS